MCLKSSTHKNEKHCLVYILGSFFLNKDRVLFYFYGLKFEAMSHPSQFPKDSDVNLLVETQENLRQTQNICYFRLKAFLSDKAYS